MLVDLMLRRPGRSVGLAELGVTLAELRGGDSTSAIKQGHVKRVFWFSFDGEEHQGFAVVSRHEGLLPDAGIADGAQVYRLQQVVDPREWRKATWTHTSPGWGGRLVRGDYAGLLVGDPLGRGWVFAGDWFTVASNDPG